MKRYEVEFCSKDTYSDQYMTTEVADLIGDFLPKIGETVEYRGCNWEVFDVIHRFVPKTGYMNAIVRVK